MATALYRRYRPETFADMIGQTQVTEPLMTALRAGRIGHAYLFSGPRGCGKTTSARVLARCLNCAEGPTDTPCGTCPSCVELSRDGGGSLDVIEIDAASHGGVDDARELRERATFAPARDRYKVFIIDEAHMVTPSGFNALLKIVEEPPEHVKFVFATTEPEKVIGTIRSRTHHYPFRLIPPAPLLEYVQELCTSEGVTVENGVLPLVIRAGGGSARDTLSILDQLMAGSEGTRISYEVAVGLLGFTHDDLLDEAVESFAAGDAGAGIGAVDRVIQTGQDPRRFVEDLLERLRDLIVVKATDVSGAAAVLRGTPEDQLRRMFEQAERFSLSQLSHIADTVSDALDRMTGTTSPRLHLELMVARVFASAARQNSESTRPLEASPERSPSPSTDRAPAPAEQSPPRTAEPAAPPSTPPRTPDPVAAPTSTREEPARAPATSPARPDDATGFNAAQAAMAARAFLANDTPAAADAPAPTDPDPAANEPVPPEAFEAHEPQTRTQAAFTLETLRREWNDMLERLRQSAEAAWGVAHRVTPVDVEGETVRIEFPTRDVLEEFKRDGASPLREEIFQVFGVRVKYLPRIAAVTESIGTAGRIPTAPVPPVQPSDMLHTSERTFGGPVAVPDDSASPEPPDPPETPGPLEPPVPPEPPAPPVEPSPPEPPRPLDSAPSQQLTPQRDDAEFIRYGEAVVREMLGAQFIEEHPLAPGER